MERAGRRYDLYQCTGGPAGSTSSAAIAVAVVEVARREGNATVNDLAPAALVARTV